MQPKLLKLKAHSALAFPWSMGQVNMRKVGGDVVDQGKIGEERSRGRVIGFTWTLCQVIATGRWRVPSGRKSPIMSKKVVSQQCEFLCHGMGKEWPWMVRRSLSWRGKGT